MTSVIESHKGLTLCETVHGTISKHFEDIYQLNQTSCNSISTIFVWTKALLARGRIDNNVELINFAINLEKVTIETVMIG